MTLGSGKSRNTPCDCGCGRKVKECPNQGKRPRRRAINLDFGQSVALRSISLSAEGVLSAVGPFGRVEPVAANLTTSYDRSSGKAKVVSQTPLVGDRLILDETDALRRFSKFIAIDTNAKTVESNRISCTGVVEGRIEHEDGRLVGHGEVRQVVEFHGIADDNDRERIGWAAVIGSLRAGGAFTPADSVAVVVDAHLSALGGFNSRQSPVIENWHLPEKVELLYASADVGGDVFPNRLLRMADRVASEVLGFIEGGLMGQEGIQPAPTGAPFSYFRVWHLVDDGASWGIDCGPA